MVHFHRNGHTMVIDGVLYFGVLESRHLWVSPVGVFVTMKHPEGGYHGSKHRNGYLMVGVSKRYGKMVLAHRIVYEVCTGTEISGEIDHLNTIKSDNRLSNLTVVPGRKANMANPITRKRVVENAKKQFRILNADRDHQVMASLASRKKRCKDGMADGDRP